jgi:hypothetical protein
VPESIIFSVQPASHPFELCDCWMQSQGCDDCAVVEVTQDLVQTRPVAC